MKLTATHFQEIALCQADGAPAAPEYIQILPAGAINPNDGRQPWRLDDPQAVIANTLGYLGSRQLLLDYNHQSEHSRHNGRPATAAGWITELQARPEGIFGKVSWTEKAAKAVAAREFRYISPVFNHDSGGRVTRLLSCALTNTPALDMGALCESDPSIHQHEPMEKDMDQKIVAQALGLPETAGEAEIIAACHSARKAQCEAEKGPDPARYVPIETHNAVTAELAALKKVQCEAEAEALVERAKSEGKLIPAQESWAKSLAQSSPKDFKIWLETAPSWKHLGKESLAGNPPDGKKEGALTPEQRAICEAMGLDEAKYLEESKKWQN